MFLGLAGLLLIVWLVLWLGLHVAGWAIHLLIIFAVISFIVHFFTGKKG